MDRLSAPLLANLSTAVDLWEIDLPDGTTWLLGPVDAPQGSTSQGWYEPRVTSFVPWEESVASADHAIQVRTFSIPIVDIPGAPHSLRDMLGRGDNIQNAPVRRYLAAEGVIHADWCLLSSGLLDDWGLDGPISGTLMVRPDDSSLMSPVLTRKASLYDFPNLPKANEGRILPFIVGQHSYDGTSNLTVCGAITTFSVDDTAFKHYVSLGYVNVLRVYVGNTLLAVTAGYTVTYSLINGFRHTIVDLVNDPSASAVTVDVEGQYLLGTGSGTPVMEAIAVTRLVLNNQVFGVWQDGAWLVESTRVSTADFDAAVPLLANLAGGSAYVSTVLIDDERTGYDFINQQCRALGIYAYQRGDGALAIWFDNPNALPVAVDTLDESDCAIDGFEIVTSQADVIAEAIGKWGAGKYELNVSNPLATTDRTKSIDLTGGPNTWP